MAPTSGARDAQHGIEEITRRFEQGESNLDRWAKLLVASSRRDEEPVRGVAAWAMGYDASREEFVARLREMLASDPSVLVRRNAACSLAKSADACGREVLRSMLGAYTLPSPGAGVVSGLVAEGVPVRENGVTCKLLLDDGAVAEVRSPVAGFVLKRVATAGVRVAAGDTLLVLGPDAKHALNGAYGLLLVGTKDDIETLDLAAAPQSQFGDDVKTAARQAAEAIRAREK